MLCINIMLTIGGISLGGDDIVSKFFSVSGSQITASADLNESLPVSLEQGSFGAGTTTFSFIDGLKMIFGVILMVLSIAIAPVYWGLVLGFPMWLCLLFIPPTIMFILGIIYTIRGGVG